MRCWVDWVPSPSSEQFTGVVPRATHFHQPFSWPTGERVLVCCPTLLPSYPGLLFKSWTLQGRRRHRVERRPCLDGIKLNPCCRSKGTPARFPNCSLQLQNFSPGTSPMTFQLWMERGQSRRLPTLSFWKCRAFGFTSRTPTTWVEIFRRRLSLW